MNMIYMFDQYVCGVHIVYKHNLIISDCVWQLQQILPSAFEFNERYLLILHDHVYSAQFGTFIGNCQKDRIDLR